VGINTVVNSFHYINLKLLAEIAGVLGEKEDSILFKNRSQLVKNSINNNLLNKERGIYTDGEGSSHSSLHANIFPLVFGVVPEENVNTVISFIKSKGMACSVYAAQYLLEALYQYGEADYALKLMTSTNERSWWHMIELGSTMTLEAWDMKYKPNLDWNHPWGTAPANIITRYMWGILPKEPAFGSVSIKPQLSNLTYSHIKVPTIKGAILAEYKQLANGNHLFIFDIPKEMNADFNIPDCGYKIMTLNKKKVKPEKNSLPLVAGVNKIELKN
ncbi:MAG: acetylglucosamine-6-sulfatase, partial [Bacteroidales bacterium]|nr:acetylglucosamine-6-sulfatase [Bacteroidales bacterium]